MGLKEQLVADYKDAMKSGDHSRKETVNLVRAAIKQFEIDNRTVLDNDEDIIPIIKKQVKMRADALDDFEKAGREDLKSAYEAEIAVLKKYLPEEMSAEAVSTAVAEIAEKSGLERDMKSMGKLMKEVMAELGGKADGSVVSKAVREYLGK
ncbi:MAG: GatB/YqeY domain-containing protein [Clostridiales bacterium]|nr:GatB/YqeY domain-containing protein [Clostridiales bacterium]